MKIAISRNIHGGGFAVADMCSRNNPNAKEKLDSPNPPVALHIATCWKLELVENSIYFEPCCHQLMKHLGILDIFYMQQLSLFACRKQFTATLIVFRFKSDHDSSLRSKHKKSFGYIGKRCFEL